MGYQFMALQALVVDAEMEGDKHGTLPFFVRSSLDEYDRN